MSFCPLAVGLGCFASCVLVIISAKGPHTAALGNTMTLDTNGF
jgi:hypothetical protein